MEDSQMHRLEFLSKTDILCNWTLINSNKALNYQSIFCGSKLF